MRLEGRWPWMANKYKFQSRQLCLVSRYYLIFVWRNFGRPWITITITTSCSRVPSYTWLDKLRKTVDNHNTVKLKPDNWIQGWTTDYSNMLDAYINSYLLIVFRFLGSIFRKWGHCSRNYYWTSLLACTGVVLSKAQHSYSWDTKNI